MCNTSLPYVVEVVDYDTLDPVTLAVCASEAAARYWCALHRPGVFVHRGPSIVSGGLGLCRSVLHTATGE